MCRCCRTSATGLRIYASDLEPCAEQPFDDRWEKKVTSLHQVKEELYRMVTEKAQSSRTPLCINPHSAAFKSFTRYDDLSVFQDVSYRVLIMDFCIFYSSTVAHPSELPPSPHQWE